MPLGSSSAAPVTRPGPSRLSLSVRLMRAMPPWSRRAACRSFFAHRAGLVRRAFAFVGLDDEFGIVLARRDLVALDRGGRGDLLHHLAVRGATMAVPADLVASLELLRHRHAFESTQRGQRCSHRTTVRTPNPARNDQVPKNTEVVPDEGLEPPTFGLQNRCSTSCANPALGAPAPKTSHGANANASGDA